ncbi:peptide/nickel transport system substrate-binding protein [Peptoclostridium litorale DSM 5388]|uniref:Uncharacterized protein n=1 Tax=Peptoclostridium litorale DSM 5388 TaxID=1121324 RepID=A0A069RKQ5_PEPLI|nr:hypothetical protein [Peptoclostridium litorale]KDR96710.1 hypothetical protein CLIT_2c03160 [Peptoclostridium litorale DSM 5388]SIN67521.1 peptide/nickel transport system substrate-binding protein [Peptoclostridium litorale DSM 5388]
MDEIFARMLGETDYQKRYEIVKEWYNEFWDTLPYIKTINYSRLHLANKSLQGYPDTIQPFFCNIWIEEQ